MYIDGVGTPRCISNSNAKPSDTIGHKDRLSSQCTSSRDDSEEHTSHTHISPRSPLPTHMSPPLFTKSAHEGGCIFVPSPSQPTPPLAHAKPTQESSLLNPHEPATLATAKARYSCQY